MRCLIVEDDVTSRTLLQNFLADYAICNIAVDGYEAVELVQTALETEKPYDLICMDIMMPNMDGKDALKAIRQIEREYGVEEGKGAKVIMTTALNLPSEQADAYEQGCAAFIVKPVRKKKFFEVLEETGFFSENLQSRSESAANTNESK